MLHPVHIVNNLSQCVVSFENVVIHLKGDLIAVQSSEEFAVDMVREIGK